MPFGEEGERSERRHPAVENTQGSPVGALWDRIGCLWADCGTGGGTGQNDAVLRKIVITLLVVGSLTALVLVFTLTDSGTEADVEASGGTDAVEQLIPTRNAETLSQAEVGVDLAPGWTGVLVLNGQELSDSEVDEIAALNQLLYRPPDGLDSGRNCMRAVVWRSAESREQSRNVDWCFEVT